MNLKRYNQLAKTADVSMLTTSWHQNSRTVLEEVATKINAASFDFVAQRCKAYCVCLSILSAELGEGNSQKVLQIIDSNIKTEASELLRKLGAQPLDATSDPIENLVKTVLSSQIDLDQATEAYEVEKLLRKILDVAMGKPSTRLACYGSLRKSEKNHHILADIDGRWSTGTVRGFVYRWNNYPAFTPDSEGVEIVVDMLESNELPEKLQFIDEFEGADYQRSLVLVSTNQTLVYSQIYSAVTD